MPANVIAAIVGGAALTYSLGDLLLSHLRENRRERELDARDEELEAQYFRLISAPSVVGATLAQSTAATSSATAGPSSEAQELSSLSQTGEARQGQSANYQEPAQGYGRTYGGETPPKTRSAGSGGAEG